MINGTFSFPTSIQFGPGKLAGLPQFLEEYSMHRPLVVTDPGLLPTQAFASLQTQVGPTCALFSGVHPNPVQADVEQALGAYLQGECDGVIGFGGGSALDVAKVVRARIACRDIPLAEFYSVKSWPKLAPFIAIPTTAGTGSEVGRSSVIVFGGRKQVLFHPSLLASLVILDPELTVDLPPGLTAATGIDALTHCIESFTSPVFHPLCNAIALEGARLVVAYLARAVRAGNDMEARGMMQIAAMMGGIAFQKDLGAVHSMAHPLSTICGMHHGLANSLCLVAVMRLNAARKPGLYHQLA